MGLLRKAAQTLGGLMFLGLFVVFLVQITARFGFNRPLPWTDELAVVLYLWVILWASAFMCASASTWCSTCSGTAPAGACAASCVSQAI